MLKIANICQNMIFFRQNDRSRAVGFLSSTTAPIMHKDTQITVVLARCCAVMAFSAVTAWAAPPEPAKPPLQGLAPANAAQFVEIPATRHTLQQLRAGGYALYLRHGTTDNTQADRLPAVDLNDCSTQRPLTEAGRQLAARVGQAMRKAQIPIGEFRVSPMCRARDSARAAFPKLTPLVDHGLMYVSNFTSAEKATIIANTRMLLSTPVPPGRNRLLLAHAPNLMEVMGYFPKEGALVVFRPKGGQAGFEYIASIAPGAWERLLP